MASKRKAPAVNRPWVDHYPSGIDWDFTPDPTPVHEKLLAICAVRGKAPALDFFGAKTSFGELGRQVRAFAGALQQKYGVKKGTRVALMLPNTPFYPIAYYGVLLAGGTVVNCNPLYTIKELTHILSNAGAEVLVTLDLKSMFEKAEALAQSGLTRDLVVCHFPDALPLIKGLLYRLAKSRDLSRPNRSSVAGKVTWFDHLIRLEAKPVPVKIDPHKDVAVQQYTGGTTGLPRGAMLSHANIAANCEQIDKWAPGLFRPPSKLVAVLPFFHIFAMTTCMNLPLCNGIEIVMLPRFELRAMLDLLVRTRANIMMAVPTLVHALASSKHTKREHLEHLQLIICGGSPLLQSIEDEFAALCDARVVEGYGLTECSPVVCCAGLSVPSRPQSIGQPIPGTDVRLLDPDDPTKIVKHGERGELAIKGPQVMLGYYEDEAATENALADGYLRTGDVGYFDDEGYIYLVDRIKDLIICSGFNVYPRVIEEALGHHPGVDECNVIGVKDAYRGEAPVAFVKPVAGAKVTAEELKKYLEGKIAVIEMPREIIFRDSLPKTLVGKMDKKALREIYAQSGEAAREPV